MVPLARLLGAGVLYAEPPDEQRPHGVAATNILGKPPQAVAPPAPPRDPLLGRVLQSQFVIEVMIGQGGFSSIYRADQPSLQRKVAVKVIHPHLSRDPDAVERFHREGLAISRLRHPASVEIYALGREEDGLLWIAMEYLQGEDLRGRLSKVKALAPAALVSLFGPVCELLSDAHEAGIIHRDLKPENLFLVAYKGRDLPKVLDFGMAGFQNASGQNSTLIGGTYAYMPPEQWRGLKYTDARSDVYALGVIAYECLAGRPPFVAEPEAFLEWATHHLNTDPPGLLQTGHGASCPPGLAEAIAQALEKDPAARFQSPLALLRAMEAGLHSGAGPAASAPAVPLVPAVAPALAVPEAPPIPLHSADLLPVEAVLRDAPTVAIPAEEAAALLSAGAPSAAPAAAPAPPVVLPVSPRVTLAPLASEEELLALSDEEPDPSGDTSAPWKRRAANFLRAQVELARAQLPFAPLSEDIDPEDVFFQAVEGVMKSRLLPPSALREVLTGPRPVERLNIWWEAAPGLRYSLFVRGAQGRAAIGLGLLAPQESRDAALDRAWAALSATAPGARLGHFLLRRIPGAVAGFWRLPPARLEEDLLQREVAAQFLSLVRLTWQSLGA